MAIAQAYPLGTPKTNDLIVGTSIPAVNTNEDPKTVNFSVGDIVNLAATGSGTTNTIPVWTNGPNGVLGDSLIIQTNSPDVVTIGSRFIVSPNSILALDISQGAGKALVTISDNLKVDGTYYDSASDQGTDGDVLLAKGTSGNMVTRWTSLANAGITSGIETAQVTITTAQLEALGTTDVTLLTLAGGTGDGEYLQLISASILPGGGAVGSGYTWDAAGAFISWSDTATNNKIIIPQSQLPDGSGFVQGSYTIAASDGEYRRGADLKLGTAADPIIVGTPNGTLTINLTYRIFPQS